jgi:hypothetical protein
LALVGFPWLLRRLGLGFHWLFRASHLGFCWLLRAATLAFIGFPKLGMEAMVIRLPKFMIRPF